MVGNKPSRSANAVLYVVSPRKTLRRANHEESQSHNNRYARQPDQIRALEESPHAAGKQANVPPFAGAPVELPRALRSHAGKALRRRTGATGGWE
jgi:hypothetical protein